MRRFTTSFPQEYQTTPLEKGNWTAVIPAAGKGTRLAYSQAKILFPVNGKLIIEHITSLLNPFVSEGIFVFSPKNKEDVEKAVYQGFEKEKKVVIENSLGMAHSIAVALPFVETPYVIVMWGDQVALSQSTIKNMMEMMQSELTPDCVLALFEQENPYVHYAQGIDGKLEAVLQKREGDTMPVQGLADAGVFVFRTEKLKKLFEVFSQQTAPRGKLTGEWNFLPLLPWFDQASNGILAYHLSDREEARGINSREDALEVEQWMNSN